MTHKFYQRERKHASNRGSRSKHLSISRLTISKKQLLTLKPEERAMFFLIGHALNELSLFSKLVVFAHNSTKLSEGVQSQIEHGQTMIIIRTWAGKMFEAWDMFKEVCQSSPTAYRTYLIQLDPPALAAKKELQKYFSSANDLYRLRFYAFHKPDTKDLERAFQKLPDYDALIMYGGRSEGNQFSASIEAFVTMSFARASKSGKGVAGIEEILVDCRQTAKRLITLFRACQKAMIQFHFPEVQWEHAFTVADPPNLTDVVLPSFLDEPDV